MGDVCLGATVEGTPISDLCERSEDAPFVNYVLYHLRTKLDPENVKGIGMALFQPEMLYLLSTEDIVVCFQLWPFYGDEDETDGLSHSEAKDGTTAFHAFVTLYARVCNKRYTLALRRVTDGDKPSPVFAEFFGVLNRFPFAMKAVCLDRELYDSRCLALIHAQNYAYVVPIKRWGRTIKDELDEGWSRQIQHSLAVRDDGHERTVELPVCINCTYQQCRYGEHDLARHGYATEAVFIDTRYHYSNCVSTPQRGVDDSGASLSPSSSTWSRGRPDVFFGSARPSRPINRLRPGLSGRLDLERPAEEWQHAIPRSFRGRGDTERSCSRPCGDSPGYDRGRRPRSLLEGSQHINFLRH